MRLQGKNAVVYGPGRGMGRAVARSFASEGAHVFLAGQTRESLRWVAHEIRETGGIAEVAVVDPLDPEAVERHLTGIVNEHGSLDVSFNLTTYDAKLDPRLTGLSDNRFAAASFTRVRSNFITATAAARKMAYQGNGVILAMAVEGQHLPRDRFGGFAIGSAALAEMFRQLDLEVGPHGVKVACLRSTLTPDSPMFESAFGVTTSRGPSPNSSLGAPEPVGPAMRG